MIKLRMRVHIPTVPAKLAYQDIDGVGGTWVQAIKDGLSKLRKGALKRRRITMGSISFTVVETAVEPSGESGEVDQQTLALERTHDNEPVAGMPGGEEPGEGQ